MSGSSCALALLLAVSGCALDADPHAAHANRGAPSGAECPEDSHLRYESFGAAFLGRYCVDCHSSTLAPAERQGAPFGADYDSHEGLLASGISHVDYVAAAGPEVENDFMPPRDHAVQPTLAEREALGSWLACGAP